MTPSRPYLLRAIYEWIVDNDMTPYMLVDATAENVQVPRQYVENGKIVLNVGPRAVEQLDISNEAVRFNARFSGRVFEVYFPVQSALAIYARENGQGMVFSDEDEIPPDPSPDDNKRPHLKVVK
ncbi:MAG TPA: ClpXP protease specificity-enhancing factor [Gammaproteobacteria bacterium]|nr:ClpXP protease specificity-enhancing factor [Gammaproteobacteria bacterium]